ncbi:MAG: CarD family transcriptional regulator [Faecalibacterium sp.]|nr:CarD family transcriptional regulator [Ruminococcus sp.]MCM1393079.1 CarD family transcriptional regulator [Ruminococcus sp.]MCM1485163.1 CarD family transcriptional regulator [Faecalibacterium sp.]
MFYFILSSVLYRMVIIMYKSGDTVIYQNTGVCKIVDIRYEAFGKSRVKYYVLNPLCDTCSTKIYVPVGSEDGKFKAVVSGEEIAELIEKVSKCKPVWTDNDKLRDERFSQVLADGDRVCIMKMISEIHAKRSERAKEGKRLKINDERTLRTAETIIGSEFAFVLGIEPDAVGKYIVDRLKVNK